MASRRYTYSRTINTIEGTEKFEAHEWDSFDEARTAVEKGIRDRKIQLEEKYPNRVIGNANMGLTPSVPYVKPEVMKSAQATLNAPGQIAARPGATA